MWVIGDGPRRAELERRAGEGVEILGRIPEAERNERIARAHVLVATSIREGWGLNVSEAAAYGTPAIGYAVPGLVDSIPASGGALVDAQPKALGDALTAFFEGRLQLHAMPSARPWADVAAAVEAELVRVVGSYRS
jgi:glycosyltransferase involved in cell wall biosynthesis